MFCPNCGNKIEDDAKFCENCGAAINNKSETVINDNSEQNTVAHTSKKKIVVIAIISFLVLLIVGVAAYFIHEEIQIKRGADEILSLMENDSDSRSDPKTYSITFEADELIQETGVTLGGHVGVAVLSNLTCSNGNANIETETIYIYNSLVRVEVTGAEAGEVVLGGTITTYGLDMYQGETVSYPAESGVFLISKTVGN